MSFSSKSAKLGALTGLAWAIGLVWIGTVYVNLPIFTYTWTLALALMFPGLFLALLLTVRFVRNFFERDPANATSLGSDPFLQDSLEQSALALLLWPAIGYILVGDGPGVVLCLGIGFLIARLICWAGGRMSVAVHAFGFTATFLPTIVALIWSGLYWLTA